MNAFNTFKSTFEMSTSHYYSLMLLYNVYQRIFSDIIFHKILTIRTRINSIKPLLRLNYRARDDAFHRRGKVCDLRIPYGEIKERKGLRVRKRDEVRDEIGRETVSGRARTTNQSFLWNDAGKVEGGGKGRGKTKVIADNRMARDSD